MKEGNYIYNISKKCFLLLVLMIAFQPFANAQTLKATADKTTIIPNEVITVTYSVDADADDFQQPDLKDFEVLSGPNVSTRISVYNTQMMRNTSYSFLLRPIKTGTFTIPPASVEVKGKRIKSNSIKITVVNAGNAPSNQENNTAKPNANAFGKDNVFLQLNSNKKEVYQGEAIAVNCKIFLREVNIQEYQFLNPSFEGFWVEEVQLPKPTAVAPERVNGKTYQAGTIRKVILYPQKSGKLKLGPLELEAIGARQMSRNLLDDFFSGRPGFFDEEEPVRALINSNTLNIQVKPLPQPQPQAFTGFVGDAKVVGKLSSHKVRANEPVTFTITLAGKGNFNNVQPFKIDLGDAAEVYTPETEEQLDNTGIDINGTKTFTYTIVPRKEGKLFIPPVKFSYFDPQQGKYVEQKTNGFNVEVEKGLQSAQPDTTPYNVEEAENNGRSFWSEIPGWLWVLLATLPIAALIFFLLKWKNPEAFVAAKLPVQLKKESRVKSAATVKQLNITEDINYKLQEAEEWLGRNHLSLFYASLAQAFHQWLQQKTELPPALVNEENIHESLSRQNTSREDTDRIIKLLQKLEYIRYAPVSQQQNDAQADLQEAKHFLKN